MFRDPLGAVLAASWAVLAASWGRLGGLGGLLGPSWARLGGRNRTPSRPNIDPKIDQNFDAFGDRLFGRILVVFTSQYGAKMPPKTSWTSMSMSKAYFFKKPRFSTGKTMILVVLEAQLRTA